MKLKYLIAFFAIGAVIVYGSIKGWFSAKKAESIGTTGSLNLPSFSFGGGSSSSGGSSSNTGNNDNPVTVPTNTLASVTNPVKKFALLSGLNVMPLASNLLQPIAIQTYSDNGYLRTKSFPVFWNISHRPFTETGIKPWQVGLSGCNDVSEENYGTEYIGGGNNVITPELYYGFTSSIPYYLRMQNDAYINDGSTPEWDSWTLEQVYDKGLDFAGSHKFGAGDNLNGKTKRNVVAIDLENSSQFAGDDKNAAVLMGMADGTLGFVCDLYSGCFKTNGDIYHQETNLKKYENYPDANGNYAENAQLNNLFRVGRRIDIPNRGINNELFISKRNIIPCDEVSFLFRDVQPQGSHYVIDNEGNFVIINKFGPNKTADHVIARAKTHLEWQKAYAMLKLNDREVMMMTKVFCDRQQYGRSEWNKCSDGNLRPDVLSELHDNQPMPRKYAFMNGLLTFMHKTFWFLWDKAADTTLKGYEPYLASIGLLKPLKTSGAFDLFYDMTPQLWNSEYSLDGTTWLKTKGIDLDEAENDRLCVNTCTTSTQMLVSVLRPEGGEPTECWVRASVGGTLRTVHILPEYYDTVSPEYGNADLADIPTAHKHYYFNVFSY